MRRIPLRRRDGTVRAYATVNDADYEWLSRWRWHLRNGYVSRDEGRRVIYMHRVLLGLEQGDPRGGDHIDRKRTNNQRHNLRIAVRGQADNTQNQGVRSNNTSGYRGVSRHDCGKWSARAMLDGRNHYLGLWNTPEEANDMVVAWRALYMPFSEEAAAA